MLCLLIISMIILWLIKSPLFVHLEKLTQDRNNFRFQITNYMTNKKQMAPFFLWIEVPSFVEYYRYLLRLLALPHEGFSCHFLAVAKCYREKMAVNFLLLLLLSCNSKTKLFLLFVVSKRQIINSPLLWFFFFWFSSKEWDNFLRDKKVYWQQKFAFRHHQSLLLCISWQEEEILLETKREACSLSLRR